MEYKSLLRALSVLLSVIALFMVPCLLAGFAMGEGLAPIGYFALPIFSGAAFFLLSLALRSGKMRLSPRSGYLFVTLSWVAAAALGASPYVISGYIADIPSALFEAMSGFTTTGATILTDIEIVPRSLLLWRATTHWLGGMGIVGLTVAIFPLLGISGRSIMEAESPGPSMDKFTPRLSQTAGILWLIYLGLTIILTVLLMLGGMSLFDAVCHAFSAMATGGFSTRNASVAAFNSAYIDGVLTAFMVMAGMNFSLYWRLLRGKWRDVLRDSEFRAYLAVFFGASALCALNLLRQGTYSGFWHSFRFASFQVASLLTTTGSVTADYLQWPAFAQAILFVTLMIGGCAGSTAGGIKVGRFVTLFKMGFMELRHLLTPRGVHGIFVNRQYVKKTAVYDIAAMAFLYAVSAIVSTLVLAFAGYDILTSLSATLASLGNIGPGFNLVGPMFTYAFFPGWVKLWLFFVMLLGRLEIFTVLVLFTRAFWKR